MAKRYFDLSDDVHVAGRSYLGTPINEAGQEHGSWLFMRGEPAQVQGRLRVPIYRPGKPLDFSLADAGAIPVVHAKVASLLKEMAPEDVQLFPVEIDGQPDHFCLVNVTRLVRCIDDEASKEVEYWTPEDGRPEKTGKYRAVAGMRIDPSTLRFYDVTEVNPMIRLPLRLEHPEDPVPLPLPDRQLRNLGG